MGGRETYPEAWRTTHPPQGYTPKQLEYCTGDPKQIENLHTRDLLKNAFCDFEDVRIIEEEIELHEGAAHGGMSAVIGLTGRKRAVWS